VLILRLLVQLHRVHILITPWPSPNLVVIVLAHIYIDRAK